MRRTPSALVPPLVVLAFAVPLLPAEEPAHENPLSLLEQAEKALKSGAAERAAGLYRSAARRWPEAAGVRVRLARALAAAGREEEGLAWLESAADMGAGADWAELNEAFQKVREAARYRALRQRFEDNLKPIERGRLLFKLAEKDLVPENVAHDAADGSYYVGSLRKRKIVRVDAHGRARDFKVARQDGLWAVLGMKVDPQRRELWANTCNYAGRPPLAEPESKTLGQAAVFRYDLRTGRLLRRYPAGSRRSPVCFNDLTLTPQGDVYLTTGPDGVWVVRKDAAAVEPFAGALDFLNGIAAAPDGRRLYLAGHLSGVLTLDLETRRVEPLPLPPDATLAGIDGLYVHGASLVAVQNGLSHGPERVVQAFLAADGQRVECLAVLDRSHPLFSVPTTGVIVGEALHYVAASQLDSFDGQGRVQADKLVESPVLAVDLLPRCPLSEAAVARDRARAELLEEHRNDRRAHFERDVEDLLGRRGDPFVAVARGRIERVARDDERAHFQAYFEDAAYLEWDDLEPPIVRVSDDGGLAWVITRLKVRRRQGPAQAAEERAFVYAGIMTYEKRDGRWARVANVSTFE